MANPGNNIGNAGNVVDVAANYLKAQPSTQFGTRQLSVITITQAGVYTNYANANSLFSKTVRALQQTAEVWAVFTPVDAGTDYFNAIISTDSQWDGDSAAQGITGGVAGNGGYGVLETAIQAGSGVAATVTATTDFVAPFHG